MDFRYYQIIKKITLVWSQAKSKFSLICRKVGQQYQELETRLIYKLERTNGRTTLILRITILVSQETTAKGLAAHLSIKNFNSPLYMYTKGDSVGKRPAFCQDLKKRRLVQEPIIVETETQVMHNRQAVLQLIDVYNGIARNSKSCVKKQ